MLREHERLTLLAMKAIRDDRKAWGLLHGRLDESIRQRYINEVNPSLSSYEIIDRVEKRAAINLPVGDLLGELRKRF